MLHMQLSHGWLARLGAVPKQCCPMATMQPHASAKPFNNYLSSLRTTVFTEMTNLANQHQSVNLGQASASYDSFVRSRPAAETRGSKSLDRPMCIVPPCNDRWHPPEHSDAHHLLNSQVKGCPLWDRVFPMTKAPTV